MTRSCSVVLPLTWAMSCLSMGLREMILLVLLVSPTSRCREVGDRDTDTALLSRLDTGVSEVTNTGHQSVLIPVGGVAVPEVGSVEAVQANNCGHGEVRGNQGHEKAAVLIKIII